MASPRFLLVSIVTDNWDWLDNNMTWARMYCKASLAEGKYPAPVEHDAEFARQSGLLVLIDWASRAVLAAKRMPMPLGFVVEERRLVVATWATEDLVVLESNEITKRVPHQHFNHLHSVEPLYSNGPGHAPSSYLVTSSGTDLIIDMTLDGQVRWSWFAFEHGYEATADGPKVLFDKSRDWTKIATCTATQSTHVNSAIALDQSSVLACLPIPGKIVRIDRDSGRADVVLGGLSFPHAIRRRRGGYMLCDTRARSLVFLDHDLQVAKRQPLEATWLQDAFEADDGTVFVVSNLDRFDSSPQNQNRIIELDHEHRVKSTMVVAANNRPYQAEELTHAQATHWAEAWATERETLATVQAQFKWE